MSLNVLKDEWDLEIKPSERVFNMHLKDIWNYRDLLWLLVRRDFVSFYKQTIFGPLWFFIQPIFTTIIFTVIFSHLAKIGTEGTPAPIFYMSGTIAFNYFADGLSDNANIFVKVYFPRLIMPLSIIFSNLVKFGVQFILFIIMMAYYLIKGANVHPNWFVLLFPVIIFLMALLSLGVGLIITALTTKYRDLIFLVTFGTPVIYPLSAAADHPKYQTLIICNPLSGMLETFRYGFLGTGHFYAAAFLYSVIASIVIFLLGVVVFNRVEKDFVDTI
jgi:lipopolysaccharide transport system permease protein